MFGKKHNKQQDALKHIKSNIQRHLAKEDRVWSEADGEVKDTIATSLAWGEAHRAKLQQIVAYIDKALED